MLLTQDHYRAIEAGMLAVLKKGGVEAGYFPDNAKQLWSIFDAAAKQKHFSLSEINAKYENAVIESAMRRMAAVWRGERRNPFPDG
ncbi:hypothetical protein ACFOGJ_14185 [Marinibaculum pumilum]|uniref:Uncharacterized protein n=1 Tax=Marinibaculum pumilum TaxID=1766165 RepID=A0ABV7L1V3_9PROT